MSDDSKNPGKGNGRSHGLRVTAEEVAQGVDLYRKGITTTEIAKAARRSTQTVYKHLRDAGIEFRRRLGMEEPNAETFQEEHGDLFAMLGDIFDAHPGIRSVVIEMNGFEVHVHKGDGSGMIH